MTEQTDQANLAASGNTAPAKAAPDANTQTQQSQNPDTTKPVEKTAEELSKPPVAKPPVERAPEQRKPQTDPRRDVRHDPRDTKPKKDWTDPVAQDHNRNPVVNEVDKNKIADNIEDELDRRNKNNREGQEKLVDAAHEKADEAHVKSEDLEAHGRRVEDNRNTPIMNKDGSKSWT